MPGHNTKWFDSSFAGAPSLTGQAGSLISVLNACLVDGFNLLTLDSLVVASNVATGTKNGHGYKQYQIIEIAGAAPSSLNGKWRVTSVTSNTFTFTTAGISNQTATGTITAKTASAGWAAPFTGTNTAVYNSQSAQRSGNHGVRVTDTGTTTATCLAAEEWTDINTSVNNIQTFYVAKSSTADATARGWTIVADDRTIYIGTSKTGGMRELLTWGDFLSIVAADGHAFHVRAPSAANASTLGYRTSLGHVMPVPTDCTGFSARDYSQGVGASANKVYSLVGAAHSMSLDASTFTYSDGNQTKSFAFSGGSYGTSQSGATISYSTYSVSAPSPADGGIHFVPVYLFEYSPSSAARLRGTVRGLLHIIETRPLTSDVIVLPGLSGVNDGLAIGFRTLNENYGYNAGSRIYPETHIAIELGDWD